MKLFNWSSKKKQADKIAVWIVSEDEDNVALVCISNESSSAITKIILSTVNMQGKISSGKDTPPNHRAFLSQLPPGKYFTKLLVHHGMNFLSGIELSFTDSAGNNWVRDASGKLNSIKETPAEFYDISQPISWELPQNYNKKD